MYLRIERSFTQGARAPRSAHATRNVYSQLSRAFFWRNKKKSYNSAKNPFELLALYIKSTLISLLNLNTKKKCCQSQIDPSIFTQLEYKKEVLSKWSFSDQWCTALCVKSHKDRVVKVADMKRSTIHGRGYDTVRIFDEFQGWRPPPTPSTKSIF